VSIVRNSAGRRDREHGTCRAAHDDAAGFESVSGFVDRVAAARDAEVRLARVELVEQAIDARLEIAPGDGWPHRGRKHRRREHLVERAHAVPNQARQLQHVAARLRVAARRRNRRGRT
jgi:hypothetical protein